MKLLVLGATGPLGMNTVAQALERGHEVTAVVRDPAKLGEHAPRIRVERGDVIENPAALDAAVPGHDAVIGSLGVGRSLASGALIERSTPNIIAALQRGSVRRLVFVSAFGVGDMLGDAPWLPGFFFRTLLRGIYADKEAGHRLLAQSPLDWTIVAPVRLTDGPRTGRIRAGERLDLRGMPSVSRADVAAWMLDEAESPRHIRKTVVLSS